MVLCNKIYTETIIDTNTSNIPENISIILLIYSNIFSLFILKNCFISILENSVTFSFIISFFKTESSGNSLYLLTIVS